MIVERELLITDLDRDSQIRIITKDKLAKITDTIFILGELDNSDNLKDGRPSNILFTYYVYGSGYFTSFEPKMHKYKKLKNGEIVSLTLRITDQNGNIMANGLGTTVVPHISKFLLSCFKMEYRNKLNPERSLRTAHGIIGTRQKVTVTHNPSKIDQNQLLMVLFPKLGSDDVIIPGTVKLSFNIELSSLTDKKKNVSE